MTEPSFIPLPEYRRYPEEEMLTRARAFMEEIARRRSVRTFSDEPVPREVLEALAPLHWAGLACLTHTPSPMGFLNELLERPESERPFLLLVVGYPAADARVPDLERKPLDDVTTFLE